MYRYLADLPSKIRTSTQLLDAGIFGESPRTLGRDCHGVVLPSPDPTVALQRGREAGEAEEAEWAEPRDWVTVFVVVAKTCRWRVVRV